MFKSLLSLGLGITLFSLTANNFRSQITDNTLFRDFPEIAIEETNEANTQISQLILPPEILTSLSDKTKIIVVPDGGLNYLPLNLLFLPNSPEFLFTQYDIIHNPSSSTIDSLRKFAVSEQKAPRKLAIAADAVFSTDDDRVDKVDKGDNLTVEQLYLERTRNNVSGDRSDDWERLPYNIKIIQ